MRKLSIACIASMIILVILHILFFKETEMFSWLYIIPLILAVIELVVARRWLLFGVFCVFCLAGYIVATVAIPPLFDPPAMPPIVEQEDLDDAPSLEQTPYPEQGDDIEQENEPTPPYSEEQLEALGKVMVCGDLLTFLISAPKEGEPDEYPDYLHFDTSLITITFVDRNMLFAAAAHEVSTMPAEDFLFKASLASIEENGLVSEEPLSREMFFAYIDDLGNCFNSHYGLFGKLRDFAYDESKKMGFGVPEVGAAKIFLEMPDNKSGWYEINIAEHYYLDENTRTSFGANEAFSFVYTDARLPENFGSYEQGGRSGSPIIQRGRLIGAFAGRLVDDSDFRSSVHIARLAADMRFAQLQRYDENFDAELFRDVPTLKDYFD